MATITPTVATNTVTDQFVLSIVIIKDRVHLATEEGLAVAVSPFAGEIELDDAVPTPPLADQMRVADLRNGDWLLLTKRLSVTPNATAYRWTKILGADELDGTPGLKRRFTIANDDFLKPPDKNGNSEPAHAIFMRGVIAVYEKIIRLDNSTLWN